MLLGLNVCLVGVNFWIVLEGFQHFDCLPTDFSYSGDDPTASALLWGSVIPVTGLAPI